LNIISRAGKTFVSKWTMQLFKVLLMAWSWCLVRSGG